MENSFWIAFAELTTGRQSGFGQSPLSRRDIEDYCEKSTGIPIDYFLPVIRSMDRAYLDHKSEAGKKFTRDMLKK